MDKGLLGRVTSSPCFPCLDLVSSRAEQTRGGSCPRVPQPGVPWFQGLPFTPARGQLRASRGPPKGPGPELRTQAKADAGAVKSLRGGGPACGMGAGWHAAQDGTPPRPGVSACAVSSVTPWTPTSHYPKRKHPHK